MAKGDKYKVTCSALMIRSDAGVDASAVGKLAKGDIFVEEESKEITNSKNNKEIWIKHDKGGWSCQTGLAEKVGENGEVIESNANSEAPEEEADNGEDTGYQPDINLLFESTPKLIATTSDINIEFGGKTYTAAEYNKIVEKYAIANEEVDESEFSNIKSVMGVFGLPYQFLKETDTRLIDSNNSQKIGYEYAERIIERIPLLFIAPGKASFMTKYSKKSKENILQKILSMDADIGNTQSLDDLISKDGRYYTFEYDTTSYYKIVNPMCRIAARFMGIQDIKINGEPLDKINWENYTRSGIKSIGNFGTFTSIPFYIDASGLSTVSESFNNSTTQSMIASTVNSASDMARELTFLLGTVGSQTGLDRIAGDADVQSNINNIQSMLSKIMGKGNFLSNLANHLTTVAAGGRLIFPEIWADSSFSRSYSCEMKFISPDPSNLSVYLNVIVPLMHLLALVSPQTVDQNPNGYINPFLVRAIYKGHFNIDTGIITGMSVSKGAECQWTIEGIPTSITVNIDIKDLYNLMSVSSTESTEWKFDTLNNTALMDYIANLCGINIFKPEIARMIDMWYVNNFSNRITDFFKVNIWGGVQQKIQNAIMGIYR